MVAADISNAFSRTQRECQLYELWRTGARGAIFLFCKGTYRNTYRVIRQGGTYSRTVEDLAGSKQGGSSLRGTSWYTIVHGQES